MELELSTEHFELGTTNDFVGHIPLSNPEVWQPRWYYIMRNKTSGKLYAGQTTHKNMDWYCGSGRYWVPHCNKHGGYDRTNIEVVEQTWFTEESDAQAWLDRLEARVPDYWCGNPQWANRVLESTESSPLAGEAGSRLASRLARKRIANGTHNWAGEAGSRLQRERVKNGTHNLAGELGSRLARKRIANGTHHLAGELGSKLNRDMVAKGIHPSQQKARLKAFYQSATSKFVNANKLYKNCPEELELQALGYDTQAIRYGTLKWPEAA